MHFRNRTLGKALASSVAALLATTGLYAIPKGPCEQKPAEVCCDEPKPGPFGFAYPADMGLTCPRNFYIHVDGLAFQAKQDGMDFVLDDSSGSGTPSAPITRGELGGFSDDHTDWDFNPGVRVGVGFFLDHDAWNLDFNWTWLNITDYRHQNETTNGGSLIPLWVLGSSTPTSQIGYRSSGVWDADYNTVDASLGKPFHVSRYLVLAPHFGARFAWIDQHFSVDYNGNNAASVGTRTIHHGENDFWGVGGRVGLDSNWILGKGWSLFANMATSMIFGKFDIEQSMFIPGSGSDGFDLDYHYYQNTPNMEMALGVAWGKYFDKHKYHVSLKAAYEFHEWWDQLNMRKFFSGTPGYANDVVSRGNFTLNGFSLSLQLDI